jgi:outer membrane protein assembly factor BamB
MRRPATLALLAWGLFTAAVPADDWPQWLGPHRDGVWRETGILQQFSKDGPKVRWRVPVGIGYAGPAVAQGRVYVTDQVLDKGVLHPRSGFSSPKLPGKERIHCLDEKTGQTLWTYAYECTYEGMGYSAGPRATPAIHDGKVYSLGAMGDLVCLDAATGKKVWARNFHKEYEAPVQTWGFSASPLVDGDKVLCLVGGEAVAVAFDRRTGKELWRSIRGKAQGYCPPMIYQVAGRRQLIIWEPEAVHGLDPETGQEFWSQPFAVKAALTIPTPRLDGNLLFVTSFYNGPLLLQLDAGPSAKVVWKGKSNSEQPDRTDGLHSIIPTPVIKDGYIYGVCSYGELRCLNARTGERLWMTRQPTTGGEPVRWANAFLIPQGDRFFLPNEKGDLIIARLTPKGYEEISRARILEPTNVMAGRPVVWSHPAFANKCMYARNDKEIVCVSLAAE